MASIGRRKVGGSLWVSGHVGFSPRLLGVSGQWFGVRGTTASSVDPHSVLLAGRSRLGRPSWEDLSPIGPQGAGSGA